MEFKDRLQKLMDEKGITPYNIGINTSVKRQSVSSYIHGEAMPTSDKLQALADYLNTTTDYLLYGSDDGVSYEIENNNGNQFIKLPYGQFLTTLGLCEAMRTILDSLK